MNDQSAPDSSQPKTADKPDQPAAPSPAPSRRRSSGRGYWIAAALAVVVLAVVLGVAWLELGRGSSIQYATAPVTRGTVARTVTATGTVNPELTIIVGTYVSGVIQEVSCDYNTKVTQGQVCAKIDPRPYQTVVDQSKANLAVAQAQLEKDKAQLAYARRAYDRASSLITMNAVSKDALDSAKNVYDQAQAQIGYDEATIQQRQAALNAAQVNLDYTSITSPVNGTVVSRNVTMGQTVAASFQTPTLFLIATDLTKMQVDADVSESDIGAIEPSDNATFTVDAFPKRVFKGKVTQVRQSPQTVQNVVTYDVVISAGNADLSLKPGMTAATHIVVDRRDDVIRVPSAALRYRPSDAPLGKEVQQAEVWVLRDGHPTAVPVVAGLDDDTFTEIVSGDIKPGDRVITAEQSVTTSSRAATPRLRF